MVLSSADIFFKFSLFVVVLFSKKTFRNISRVSSSLDQDHSPRPNLGLNCLQIYQQTTLVSKEFMTTIQANYRVDEK